MDTDNIELHGQSVTDAAGASSVTGETLDSTSPLQLWISSVDLEGPLVKTWTIPRGTDPQETSLVLRLTAHSDLGESLEQWLKDRKSTRLNSSHVVISYAVFCLKKKL